MYERFTDRARKVLQLANLEAIHLNHEYVGTEHILLGLVHEGSGVAANVLKDLRIHRDQIRTEVEKIVQSGPRLVAMRKLPQTPRTKKVIEYAVEEARNLNHNYVGTEHLLLGLLREGEGVAAQILQNLGLTREAVRGEVLRLLGCESPPLEESSFGPVFPLSPIMGAPCQETSWERERIRSLESQLRNLRVLLGTAAGAIASALLCTEKEIVLVGVILGGIVAALGGRIGGAVAGGSAGFLLGSTHLGNGISIAAAALLGALAGVQIAEIGGTSRWWSRPE